MSYVPKPYWPSENQLQELGFFEGYDELWILDATTDTQVLIDWDEFGTLGYIYVNNRQTHVTAIESRKDIIKLIEAAKAPF